MNYAKTDHPYVPGGYYLKFPTRTWSCVDLIHPIESEEFRVSDEVMAISTRMGRYEAMAILPDGGIDPERQIRAGSFEELFDLVSKYEDEQA